MRYVCNIYGNDWLAAGKLNNDQVKAINSALETAMATFLAALPEEVALMPTFGGYYDYYSNNPTTGEKSGTQPIAQMTMMLPFGYGIPMMLARRARKRPPRYRPASLNRLQRPRRPCRLRRPKPMQPEPAKSGAEASAEPQPSLAAPTDQKAREDLLKSLEDERKELETTWAKHNRSTTCWARLRPATTQRLPFSVARMSARKIIRRPTACAPKVRN